MTRLLERAYAEASRLPEEEQDAIASLILEEIASEARWQQAFAASEDTLAALADRALAEHREGVLGDEP